MSATITVTYHIEAWNERYQKWLKCLPTSSPIKNESDAREWALSYQRDGYQTRIMKTTVATSTERV